MVTMLLRMSLWPLYFSCIVFSLNITTEYSRPTMKHGRRIKFNRCIRQLIRDYFTVHKANCKKRRKRYCCDIYTKLINYCRVLFSGTLRPVVRGQPTFRRCYIPESRALIETTRTSNPRYYEYIALLTFYAWLYKL